MFSHDGGGLLYVSKDEDTSTNSVTQDLLDLQHPRMMVSVVLQDWW